jgi:outer membrane protein TolC
MALPSEGTGETVAVVSLEDEQNAWMQGPEIQPLLDYASGASSGYGAEPMALDRLKAQERVRRSVFLPSVSAFASESGSRGDHGRLHEGDFSTTVGVAVNYNLFSGGRDRALLEEAKSARAEAENRLESTLLAVTGEVRQSAAAVIASQEQLDLQRANTVFVEKNRDLVKKNIWRGRFPWCGSTKPNAI